MGKGTLKFKELEYLLKMAIPELKFVGWNKEGAEVEIPFWKLRPQRETWQQVELFRFQNFLVTKQAVDGKECVQVILDQKRTIGRNCL